MPAGQRGRDDPAGQDVLRRAGDASVLILTSLADGPKHGYALIQDIKGFAGLQLGPGTLYGALDRLEGLGLVEALPADDRRHHPLGERDLLPRVLELDVGPAAGPLGQRVGAVGDPLAAGADVALHDAARALGVDDLDVDGVRATAGAHVDARLAAEPAIGAGVLPVAEDVVGEGLVVGHDIEEVVDLVDRLRDVGGDSYRFHVPHGTLTGVD